MAKQHTIDCSKSPSGGGCDIKISGSNKNEVLATAEQHAIKTHGAKADDPNLKKDLEKLIEEKNI